MAKHQQHAAVADRQPRPLKATDAPAVQQGAQNQHQRGIEVQNQAFKRRADIGQPGKIKIAGKVVTGKTQPGHTERVRARQDRRRHALARTARPPGHGHKKRQGQQHAQHQKGDGVHTVPVGQLDDDGLAAESHRAKQGHGQAGRHGRQGQASGWRRRRRHVGRHLKTPAARRLGHKRDELSLDLPCRFDAGRLQVQNAPFRLHQRCAFNAPQDPNRLIHQDNPL